MRYQVILRDMHDPAHPLISEPLPAWGVPVVYWSARVLVWIRERLMCMPRNAHIFNVDVVAEGDAR